MRKIRKNTIAKTLAALTAVFGIFAAAIVASADETGGTVYFSQPSGRIHTGGGYAATGQIPGVVYSSKVYDATSGLPTSDANYVLGSEDGYIWIGGYGGIFKYDGSSFEKLDSSGGLTNARGLFEDSRKRIWVGTNDNGVVMISPDEKQMHFTYEDGLPSSSIRVFAEDLNGNIFIGTTAGVCYIDPDLKVHTMEDSRLDDERVLRLDTDANGTIYGVTKNGLIFTIADLQIKEIYTGSDLGIGNITTILDDPQSEGKVYIGTDAHAVYFGKFGDKRSELNKISVSPLDRIQWMCYACERVWVASTQHVGYLDSKNHFQQLNGLAIDSSIEMMAPDYQGNMWFASSTQGVMKIVPNNFENLTQTTSLPDEVVNATLPVGNLLYAGTNAGLKIINQYGKSVENELTEYLGNSRIRCLETDADENLWIATFNKDLGLVCYKKSGEIVSYTKETGLPNSEIRCLKYTSDHRLLVGTNDGVAILKNGRVVKTAGVAEGIHNSVVLCLEEDEDGRILIGSDGDGIYLWDDSGVSRIGREDGLSSDVILQIQKDEERDVYWIVTSNSIEYRKDGVIKKVSSFPYDNNYQIIFDENDGLWVMASCGIFNMDAEDLLSDRITSYSLYSVNNGIPFTPTANAFSRKDEEGNLYIAGRNGVIKVNIDNFTKHDDFTNIIVRTVDFNGEIITPKNDVYVIPAGQGRIRIKPALLDYTMSDPIVKVFFQGEEAKGVQARRSVIPDLEYTDLKYGKYVLHIQILDNDEVTVLREKTFLIEKKPRFFEMTAVRFLLSGILLVAVSVLVWRILSGTVVRKQYRLIREAKEEAERANTAKSRFLANISNELLNPVSTIMGMDEMILREKADDVPKPYYMSVVNYALDIKNASDSLNSMVRDLIELSNLETGKTHLEEHTYNVREFLDKIISAANTHSDEKGLKFESGVMGDLPEYLFGDLEKIRQILMNLLMNAVKYTEEGSVSFFVYAEDKTDKDLLMRFEIADTGSGMSQAEIDALMNTNLGEEALTKGPGLGIGISRRFADVMNGSLKCESTIGKGTVFEFSLRQQIDRDAESKAENANGTEQKQGPYVPQFVAPDAEVLVADFNPKNLELVKGLLRETKIFVTTFASKEDCLDKIKRGEYALALVDPTMPGTNAEEFIGLIQSRKPDLPVYAFTADPAEGVSFYTNLGYRGVIAKPVDSLLLEKTIMKHLPGQIMMKPALEEKKEESGELPEELKWIASVPEISLQDGIKACGGRKVFLSSLRLFYDTIEHNAEEIEKALSSDDMALYTVKIRILKSSARFIGANELAIRAEGLEAAGRRKDKEYIAMHHEEVMKRYRAFRQILGAFETPQREEADG